MTVIMEEMQEKQRNGTLTKEDQMDHSRRVQEVMQKHKVGKRSRIVPIGCF